MGAFQEIWDKLRKENKHITKYPYDVVVSFVFRYYPKDIPRNKINVLDVGCGVGNHLWFLAKEGFNAYGIDGSEEALKIAEKILDEFGVKANIKKHDFAEKLPFEDEFFHLVIDRHAITSIRFNMAKNLIDDINRVLKKGGYFFFSPYSTKNSSYSKELDKDGSKYINTIKGGLAGIGYVQFYEEEDIYKLFPEDKWEIVSLIESVSIDKINNIINGSYYVVAKKK